MGEHWDDFGDEWEGALAAAKEADGLSPSLYE